MTLDVVVVEDHAVLAQALVVALREHGLDAGAPPTAAAPRHVGPRTVVLLDLDLGADGDGSLLVPVYRALGAEVLVLTGGDDLLAMGRALAHGAVDVLSKATPLEDVVGAVRAVRGGSTPRPAHVRGALVRTCRTAEADRRRAEAERARLTPRGREVLEHLAQGHGPEEVARECHVALSTVRSQVRAVLTKLGVHSQLAAVARARDLHRRSGHPSS